MSATYQKPYVLPEGFPAFLKAFTREILRAQPDSIYDFGAEYFADMLENGGGPSDAAGPSGESRNADESNLQEMTEAAAALDVSSMSASELESVVMRLFLAADADGSGFLDSHELSNVLSCAELSLSDREIRAVLSEADGNADNVIEYKEFLPVMIEILQFIKVKEQTSSAMAKVESIVRHEVEDMLLHGLSREELQSLMQRIFKKADKDGSGALSFPEFKDCLKAAELGLTRKDINLIMSQVDVSKDNVISYEEFLPVCFEILVERFKDEIITSDILNNQDGLQGLLLQAFKEADVEGSGHLTQTAAKRVMKDLSYQTLGLNALQQISLLSQAPVTPDGLIHYVQFVPTAAAMIFAMFDLDNMKIHLQAIQEAADSGGMKALSTMDFGELRSLLEAQFSAADTEGNGQLGYPQVMEILSNLSLQATESMQLSDSHMRAMFASIDEDDDGTVCWTELVNFICDVIEHVEREQFLAQRTGDAAEAPATEA
eukprot:gene28263-31368_t